MGSALQTTARALPDNTVSRLLSERLRAEECRFFVIESEILSIGHHRTRVGKDEANLRAVFSSCFVEDRFTRGLSFASERPCRAHSNPQCRSPVSLRKLAEPRDAKIKADRRLRLGHRLHVIRLDYEGHKPATALTRRRFSKKPGKPSRDRCTAALVGRCSRLMTAQRHASLVLPLARSVH
jgi:hypothetical protein